MAPPDGGLLGRTPVTVAETLVPQYIAVEGDHVYFEYEGMIESEVPPKPLHLRSADGMLDALVRVHEPRDVEAFVRRYGAIGFCVHRLPAGHNPAEPNPVTDEPVMWRIRGGRVPLPNEGDTGFCVVARDPAGRLYDPVSAYLNAAAQFRAALDIAVCLRRADSRRPSWNDLGTAEQWAAFSRGFYTETPNSRPGVGLPAQPLPVDIHLARLRFAAQTRLMQQYARIRLGLDWPADDAPRLAIEADVFGTLVIQLIAAVTGTNGLAICDGCGLPYVGRKRRPQAGRRNYCDPCKGDGKHWRDAKRDQRQGTSKPRQPRGDNPSPTKEDRP